MESKFGLLTIPELKAELKSRGAKLSGRKNELRKFSVIRRKKHCLITKVKCRRGESEHDFGNF